MDNVLWVGIGGAVGSVLRYVLSGHVQKQIQVGGLLYGTLAVNVIGCLLMGFLSQVARIPGRFSNEGVLFLLVGALGAFTTFSTFSKEAVGLFQSGRVAAALVHVGIQVVLGLVAVGGGYEMGRFVQRWRA